MAEVFNEGIELLSEGDVSALLGSTDFWAMAPLQDARPNGGITAHVPPKTCSEARELFIHALAVQPAHQRCSAWVRSTSGEEPVLQRLSWPRSGLVQTFALSVMLPTIGNHRGFPSPRNLFSLGLFHGGDHRAVLSSARINSHRDGPAFAVALSLALLEELA